MAFWKRSSRKFEPVSSQTRYTVTYLGHEEMKGKVGLDNTLKPVDDLYKQFKKVKSPSKMEIEVVNNGIRVVPLDAGVRTMFANSPYFVAEGPFGNVFFPINKLSFGAADPFHTKVFCFVSRNDNPAHDSYWDCHAVVCESPTMAKNLTLYLVKAFQRVGNSKGDPIRDAQQNKKTTTVHIIREKSTMEHQSSSRRKTKPAPVSTLKVTLNIEGKIDLNRTESNDNKKVADIIAKHRSVNLSDFDQLKEPSDGESTPMSNSVSKGVGTSSDKENNEMEGVDNGDNGPKEIVVTVAVNPDLNSPPESPRKSPLPQERAASSGDDDDVAFDPILEDGNISPQEMITTMSPPDTPGYLSKEGKPPSPTLPVTPTKPPSPKRQGSSNPSPRKKTQAPSPPFQNTPAATDVSSSPRQKSPRQSPTKTSPPRKPDDASHDVLRRKPPSPSPTKRPSVTPTSPTQKSEMKSEALPRALPRSEDALSSTSSTNVSLHSNSLQNDTSGVALRSKPKSNSPTSSTSEKIDDAAPEKKKKNRKSVRFAEEEDVVIN